MNKIKLPKGARSFSGEVVLDRRGGDMWEDLAKWLHEENEQRDDEFIEVRSKMRQIEKDYGVE
jgi:hypothetical protein